MKIVLFDLDGTIANTLPLCIAAFKKAVVPYLGREITLEEATQSFGLNEEGMTKHVVGEQWEQALDDFHRHYADMHAMCPAPFEGVCRIIGALKASGTIVALVTGKGEHTCSITLNYYGIGHYFDYIETGSPVKNRKAEAIASILERTNIPLNEAVYVGDAVSDVTACREVGIECLSVAWADCTNPKKLEQVNSGNVLYSIDELSRRLGCNASDNRKWEILSTEYLIQRPWLTARRDHVKLPTGAEIPEYYVLEYPDWVNIIAITKEREFVMVRQYRHGLQETRYELCAGVCEKGEDPMESARRELYEETGFGGGTWRRWMTISANPGTTTNLTHCYLATDVERISTQHLEETEDLTVHLLTETEVRALLEGDEVRQALMAAPLWKYFAERGR